MQIDEQTIKDAADRRVLESLSSNEEQVRSHFSAGVTFAQSIHKSLAGDGAHLIELERLDQLKRGYDPAHDDKEVEQELAIAAALYAADGTNLDAQVGSNRYWPWPSDSYPDRRGDLDRIRQLTIAGGLIAAEIDRLIRKRDKESGVTNG